MNRIRLSFRKMCCAYVLICTTIPVSGRISKKVADDIKKNTATASLTRYVPTLQWWSLFPQSTWKLLTIWQPGVYDWKRGYPSFMVVPAVMECTNCSLHATVGTALGETVSLSTVPGPSWQVLVTPPPLKHGNELSFNIPGSGMCNFAQPFTDTALKVCYIVHQKR